MILLHIITAEHWDKTKGRKEYRSGTFDYEGFIHCSRPEQIVRTAQIHFPGQRNLLLLCIDPYKVQAPIWFENLDGGSSLFPHIYGPLNLEAVVDVLPFEPDEKGVFTLPAKVEELDTKIHALAPQRAAEMLAQVPGGILLDVATGGGGFLGLLAESLKEVRLPIGIDTQPSAARNPNSPFAQGQATFSQMDGEHLGLADASLDCAGLANSLHHLEDPLQALREARRAIRPGGYFILQEMYSDRQTPAQESHVLLHHWWAAVDRGRGISHRPTYTRAEIVALLEQCGWRRVMLADMADTSSDAHDAQLLEELEAIITRYQGLAAKQASADALQAEGEALRRRVREIGFQNASALLVLAER